ncbi:hypothetical protein NIES2100_61560 [Calothrix sp. NIES-2100]|uniref:hypothetical protein n=1 Tax=Calothrix sp. NIES-2100 TaxID=1954172 RepID=UPI000B608B3D|nr:hypothetical protein NIES2100_61560 [Calothrix sp. NIES-2100]
MGRWTPLILMAGGLAILLGTLLGINFPMGGQSASAPGNGRTSKVLPANINVNTTEGGRNNGSATESRSNVAQNNNSTNDSTSDTENSTDTTTTDTQSTDTQSTDSQSSDENQNSQPIRALW